MLLATTAAQQDCSVSFGRAISDWALFVTRQWLSPVYLNTNGRHAGEPYGEGVHIIKTAHSPSRQIRFSKALSQISPTCFSLIRPVVVDSKVKTLYQFYTGNKSIDLLKHSILFFFFFSCIHLYSGNKPDFPEKKKNANF